MQENVLNSKCTLSIAKFKVGQGQSTQSNVDSIGPQVGLGIHGEPGARTRHGPQVALEKGVLNLMSFPPATNIQERTS